MLECEYNENKASNKLIKTINKLINKAIRNVLLINSEINIISINDLKSIFDKDYKSSNKFEIINNGTIGLTLELCIKYTSYHNFMYIYNLMKLVHNDSNNISQRVNFKIIDMLEAINNSLMLLKYLQMSDEVLFHGYIGQVDYTNEKYNIASKDINRIIKLKYEHGCYCNLNNDYIPSLSEFLKTCSDTYWYIDIFIASINSLNNSTIMNNNKFNDGYKCSNCGDVLNKNIIVPLAIKNRIRNYIFKNEKINRKITSFLGDKIDCSNENEIYIFDGGNIGHYSATQKELSIKRLVLALNNKKWKDKNKCLVLNDKHKELIENNEGISSNNLHILYVSKIDDDLIMLYLWLSFKNSFIISNDEFNIYAHKFHNNIYLKNCWGEIKKRNKINFEINNSKFYVKSNVDKYKKKIGWKRNSKYIHFPLVNNCDDDISYKYCCYKIK